LATIKNLKERNMIFSGTGKNLQDASRPCWLETGKARVALISVCSTFDTSAIAGGQSGDVAGRPGLNPLRHSVIYHVDKQHYDMIMELEELTKINALKNHSIKNGYSNPFKEGTMPFGSSTFVLDDSNWIESKPDEADMNRIKGEIQEARKQADIVLVSIHAHEMSGDDTKVADMFLETFSRECIDAGANAVIGHGPHELRGIEIYKGGVIFYSLGNFIFETETVEIQPYDAYVNKNMPIDTKVGSYMDQRSKNGTVGYGVLPEIWNSVMAAWTMENGKITQIQLYPIDLGMHLTRSQKGVPRMNRDEKILEYLNNLSKPYGTNIRIENGVGFIDL
jgi:poly-gamma-glutamate synthesis protein (capsule biosynthesis protein)